MEGFKRSGKKSLKENLTPLKVFHPNLNKRVKTNAPIHNIFLIEKEPFGQKVKIRLAQLSNRRNYLGKKLLELKSDLFPGQVIYFSLLILLVFLFCFTSNHRIRNKCFLFLKGYGGGPNGLEKNDLLAGDTDVLASLAAFTILKNCGLEVRILFLISELNLTNNNIRYRVFHSINVSNFRNRNF